MYEAFREAPQSKKDRSRLKLGLWITWRRCCWR